MTAGPVGTGDWSGHGAPGAVAVSAPVRTWRAPSFSLVDANYLIGVVIGLVFLPVGLGHILFPTKGLHLGTAVWLAALGAFCLAACTACWALPVRRVQLSVDGTLSFGSPRRRLEVRPGALRSVRQFPLDTRRVIPLLVRADSGWVLMARRFDAMEDLRTTLCAHSPRATIAQFVPRDMRPGTRPPPEFLYRVMRTPTKRPPRP